MKRVIMTWVAAIAATLVLFPTTAAAQSGRITFSFPGLAERAAETVEVTLDREMLRLASKFMSGSDPDEARVQDLIRGLEGIYVTSYSFDREGMYDASALQGVRSQLDAGWQRIVNVKSRDGENVEIYLQSRNDRVEGMTIIAAEPKELTIVNIVGPIDLDKLSGLEGQFGIPRGVTGNRRETRK
ncbi:MAG TPA: DUF4252 domain-containing protein [Thermoanaerobaculia bacterium]|nr:DUF4252 domain-containing protein [Thermoanaerobaculia bacterium]